MQKTRARLSHRQHRVIITGPPSTGESTLAPLVASRYGSTLLTNDEIKEEFFDILGTGDASWSRRLSEASFATMFALAGDAVGGGGSVLLEGSFRAGEHDPAIAKLLAGSPSIRCVQRLCSVPPEVRREHLERRAREAARHAGHLDPALSYSDAGVNYLDVSALRLEYDSQSSKAMEQLFAALDACLKSSA